MNRPPRAPARRQPPPSRSAALAMVAALAALAGLAGLTRPVAAAPAGSAAAKARGQERADEGGGERPRSPESPPGASEDARPYRVLANDEGIPPAIPAVLDGPQAALAAGIPAVAIAKLRAALAGDLQPAERQQAAIMLGRALVAAGRPAEAAVAVADLAGAEAAMVRGQALLATGQWSAARAAFQPVATPAARVGEAAALRALGRLDEAAAVLAGGGGLTVPGRLLLADIQLERQDAAACASLLRGLAPTNGHERRQARYLQARLLLARRHEAEAQSAFEDLTRDADALPADIQAGAFFGLAEARRRISGPETADAALEDFISRYPQNPHLALAFARLDALYAAQDAPPEIALERWAGDEPPARAAFARYYRAQADLRQRRTDRGIERLIAFADDHPTHPLAAQAQLDAGRHLAALDRPAAALAQLEAAMRKAPDNDALAAAEIAAGAVQFGQREFLLAVNLFHSAAEHSATWWEDAVYFSALSWLHVGNFERFFEDYRRLSERAPDGWRRQTLLLEEGLLQARSGDGRAAETLRLFLRDFPAHPHRAEANLALAEIAFLAAPPRPREAADYLRIANEQAPDDEIAARAAMLDVFLADAPGTHDDETVIRGAADFLAHYPASPLAENVRMKLAQVEFRRENYPVARAEFERLAQDHPDSPFAGPALFLAGEAALRSLNQEALERAVELFEEVTRRGGELKPFSRLRQAVAQTRLGKLKEANVLFDAVFAESAEPEVRFAALAGKGDNLVTLAEQDPAQTAAAIATFDQLLAEPGLTPFWSNQARYKKARCLLKLDRRDEAISALYDIVDGQAAGTAGPEYFWFYRAGFDAGQLFEQAGDWRSAIGIYRKLAAVVGPRAEEARARATRLRLENFVWEDGP